MLICEREREREREREVCFLKLNNHKTFYFNLFYFIFVDIGYVCR